MTKVVKENSLEINVITTDRLEYTLEGDKSVYDMHRYTMILGRYNEAGEYEDDGIKVTVKAL